MSQYDQAEADRVTGLRRLWLSTAYKVIQSSSYQATSDQMVEVMRRICFEGYLWSETHTPSPESIFNAVIKDTQLTDAKP